ncbi:MAG: ABC transporter permease [Nitrospirae bacterium]|nr:ABC transporter permease [Nitrospirota bacterium]
MVKSFERKPETGTSNIDSGSAAVTIIKPESGWGMRDFRELKEYRDLFFSLAWRSIKVLYAQTVLGLSWAILRPLIQIVIFSIIFGRVAKLPTEGVPYFLFSSVAIVPWTYISQSISESSESLVAGQGMLGKVYFPRLIFPLTPVLSRLVDFGISMIIICFTMLYYHVPPTWNLLLFPLFVLLMASIPAGIGLWLSSLAIRFRDVRHAMPFVIQMLIYTAPIVYSASSIPEKYRLIYSLNPIVGVTEGFRSCLLGTSIPWLYILPGTITSFILVVSGVWYFKRMERIIVDVI